MRGLLDDLVQLLVELIRLRGELVRHLDIEFAYPGNVDRGRRGRGDRGHRARGRGQRTHDQCALDRIRQLGFSLQAVLTHRATSPILVLSVAPIARPTRFAAFDCGGDQMAPPH